MKVGDVRYVERRSGGYCAITEKQRRMSLTPRSSHASVGRGDVPSVGAALEDTRNTKVESNVRRRVEYNKGIITTNLPIFLLFYTKLEEGK